MSSGDDAPPIGAYTRDQLRQSYADAWRKHLARSPLTPLEALIADVLVLHPEYQALVQDAPAALAFDPPAGGTAGESFFTYGAASRRPGTALDRPPARHPRAARVADRRAWAMCTTPSMR